MNLIAYKKYKLRVLTVAATLPLIIYLIILLFYLKDYNGHCGMLDTGWECSKFEYYIDSIINIFNLFGLGGIYIIAFLFAFISILILLFNLKKK